MSTTAYSADVSVIPKRMHTSCRFRAHAYEAAKGRSASYLHPDLAPLLERAIDELADYIGSVDQPRRAFE
jgi:hypothetical protein